MATRRTIALLLVLAISVGWASGAQARPVRGVTCPTDSAQVVLDPGHGGSDSGATAVVNGQTLYEKNLTLQVAQRVANLLVGTYSVALTRSDDSSLGNSERGSIANACGAQVFVSIHFNSSSDPAINYTKTFWGKKNKDLPFSQTMLQALASSLGIPSSNVGQFAHGGLLTATMPSTLAETVFLSNPAEAALLADPSSGRLDQIAQALASGIVTWLG
jgi:N-acetylmuramoyl-L-alanine amidase